MRQHRLGGRDQTRIRGEAHRDFCPGSLRIEIERPSSGQQRQQVRSRQAHDPQRQPAAEAAGGCLDNVFIERLWRSLKCEAVYLHELVDGFEAERVIGTWMTFYRDVRPHSALGGRTMSPPAASSARRARSQSLAQALTKRRNASSVAQRRARSSTAT